MALFQERQAEAPLWRGEQQGGHHLLDQQVSLVLQSCGESSYCLLARHSEFGAAVLWGVLLGSVSTAQ